MLLSLFLANCLVSAAVGYVAAGRRISLLSYQMASMEAAVAAYWDRIRKRMRVESQDPQPAASASTDPAEEIARRNGLTFIKPKIIVPEVRRA